MIVLLFFRFFIFLLLIVILLPFQLIIVFFKKEYSYIIPYFFHKINCRVFGIEIKTSGNISKKIPTLLVSNHASYLDILILGSLFKTSFLSKKEVGQWPLIGILAKLQNTIFIDRKISSLRNQENLIIQHFLALVSALYIKLVRATSIILDVSLSCNFSSRKGK